MTNVGQKKLQALKIVSQSVRFSYFFIISKSILLLNNID
jgi:hypothetical protein